MSGRPIVPGFRDKTVRKAREKFAADPSRNLHKEKGAAVTAAEVAAHALPLHQRCRGKGLVVLAASGALPRRAVACACAMKRFLKAHPEIVIEATGAVFWPKKDADDRGDDATAAISRALDGAAALVAKDGGGGPAE